MTHQNKTTEDPVMEIEALPSLTENDIQAEILRVQEQTGYPPKAVEELVRAVFEARRLEEQIFLHKTDKELAEEDAKIDKLTGIANRRGYSEKIEDEIARSKRYDSKFSLIMIDIDHFKKINDEHGHETGDIVLREVARILGRNIREVDMVARYGGEEFVVILPNTDLDDAEIAARKLVTAIESATQKQDYPSVTISAGVAEFDKKSLNSETELRNAADIALYNAKEGGRNRAVTYTKGMTMPEKQKTPDITSIPPEILAAAQNLLRNPGIWQGREAFIAKLLPHDSRQRREVLEKLLAAA